MWERSEGGPHGVDLECDIFKDALIDQKRKIPIKIVPDKDRYLFRPLRRFLFRPRRRPLQCRSEPAHQPPDRRISIRIVRRDRAAGPIRFRRSIFI